jgi:hypothetical protein
LRMTSVESDILDTAFFVYERLKWPAKGGT